MLLATLSLMLSSCQDTGNAINSPQGNSNSALHQPTAGGRGGHGRNSMDGEEWTIPSIDVGKLHNNAMTYALNRCPIDTVTFEWDTACFNESILEYLHAQVPEFFDNRIYPDSFLSMQFALSHPPSFKSALDGIDVLLDSQIISEQEANVLRDGFKGLYSNTITRDECLQMLQYAQARVPKNSVAAYILAIPIASIEFSKGEEGRPEYASGPFDWRGLIRADAYGAVWGTIVGAGWGITVGAIGGGPVGAVVGFVSGSFEGFAQGAIAGSLANVVENRSAGLSLDH